LKLVSALFCVAVVLLIDLLLHLLLQRTWRKFAEHNGLNFEAARVRIFSSSPDRIMGTYRGRDFEFSYRHIELFSDAVGIPMPTTSITLSTDCPPKRRLWIGRKGIIAKEYETLIGDPKFDKCVSIDSKPKYFATSVLGDRILRQRILSTVSFSYGGSIMVYSSGRLVLRRRYPFWTERKLKDTFDLLSCLADVIEDVHRE
jgi:hypothetical protein